IKKYMTMCINCAECTKYCPSKIDTEKINKAFEKDYISYSFDFSSLFIILRYIFIFLFDRKKDINKLPFNNKRILLLKPKNIGEIPDISNKDKFIIAEEFEYPIKFALTNPDLYKKMSKELVKNILTYNPDCVYTNSRLIKLQLYMGIKSSNIKMKIL
ncbi:hypothetical protein IJS77_03800, partial [bacterium]|nr:hypothetical protein [bacterium]